MPHPLNVMQPNAVVCVLCQEPMLNCECWRRCLCGWLLLRDQGRCDNPRHAVDMISLLREVPPNES